MIRRKSITEAEMPDWIDKEKHRYMRFMYLMLLFCAEMGKFNGIFDFSTVFPIEFSAYLVYDKTIILDCRIYQVY